MQRQSKGDDAPLRSCISRAYYGALIVARDAVQPPISTFGKGSHKAVIDHYRVRGKANPKDKIISDALANLKDLREIADYEPTTACKPTDGHKAMTESSKVLKTLGAFPNPNPPPAAAAPPPATP